MAKVFVTFSVSIRDTMYHYDSNGQGHAEAEIQIDRRLISTIDPGSIFRDLVHTALIELDNLPEPEKDEDA